MPRNFLLPFVSLRGVEVGSTLCNGECGKNVMRHVHSGHVTLLNDRATCVTAKLQDKLQEKLPSVTTTSNDFRMSKTRRQRTTRTCVKLKRLYLY